MRVPESFVAAGLAVAFSSGCDEAKQVSLTTPSQIVVGSGRFVTEARSAGGFTAVAIAAGGRAIVTVGAPDSLEITAEDNILPFIESSVVNGRLTVQVRAPGVSVSGHGVTYRIGVREVRELVASAGSTIEAYGIDATELGLRLSAGSSFTGTGSVSRFDLELSAGSRADASGLRSRDVLAALSAGSTARVRVTEALTVSASAGSIFEYLGDPVVQAQTSSGSIVRRAGS